MVPPRRTVAASLLLLALVLLAAAAPMAVADHAFSHRYVVSGRVIDSLGEPVAGLLVEVELLNVDPEETAFHGACSYTPEAKLDPKNSFILRTYTNGTGDYFACYHLHVLKGPSTVFVRIGPLIKSLGMDLGHRHSFANFLLENASDHKDPQGVEHFACSYDVLGKVFRPQPGVYVEDVAVNGIAHEGTAVNVQLLGSSVNLSARPLTNPYGDFLAAFTDPILCSLPTNLRVIVTHARAPTQGLNADRTFRLSQLNIDEKPVEQGMVLPGLPGAGDTQTMLLAVAAISGVAALVGVGYVLGRRRAARAQALSLRHLAGIGGGTYGKLQAAGIDDLEDLAGADPEALARRTGLKSKATRRFVKQAQEQLAQLKDRKP